MWCHVADVEGVVIRVEYRIVYYNILWSSTPAASMYAAPMHAASMYRNARHHVNHQQLQQRPCIVTLTAIGTLNSSYCLYVS